MERWGLSPRVGAPGPGQCHVRQRHLRQRRADGDLADQPADAPCTPRARTARPYSWRAQRQCRAPSLMRSAMMARALSAPFGRRASLARVEKILHYSLYTCTVTGNRSQSFFRWDILNGEFSE